VKYFQTFYYFFPKENFNIEFFFFFFFLKNREIAVTKWGQLLLLVLPRCFEYIQEAGRDIEENERHWAKFGECWAKYLEDRKILEGDSNPVFPDNYDVDDRDKYYTSLSLNGWGGSMGHDAPMIA
jgi:ADP-ribosylarginine hydrolase